MNSLSSALLIPLFIIASFVVALGQNVSDEARRHFDRGIAAVEIAKTPEDLNLAIAEFKQATVLAPAWADAYYNLGKVQEAAEKYEEAIASFRKYMQLVPEASDAMEVASLINKLVFKAEQVLSIPAIIDVLASFTQSGWKRTAGECLTANLAIKRVDLPISDRTDSVSVGQPLGGVYDRRAFPDGISWQNKKVSGPNFKYVSQHEPKGICGGNPYLAGNFVVCPYLEVEIEVVSKTHVRANQKIINLYGINSPYVGKTYLCEYRKLSVEPTVAGGAGVVVTEERANVKDNFGSTSLHSAVTSGNVKLVELLIAKGAGVNARNAEGNTALEVAAHDGSKEIAEFLIAKGADLNNRNNKGGTALHTALAMSSLPLNFSKCMEVFKLLIAKGSDVNIPGIYQMTPLHYAAYYGNKEAVELLIGKGADANAKDQSGNTPLQIAENRKHAEVVEILKKLGAK